MKLRNKLILSNIIVLILVGITLVAVFYISMVSFFNITGLSMEQIRNSQNNVYTVESYVTDSLNKIEYSQTEETRKLIFSEMDNELRNRGYEIELIKDREIIDTNIGDLNKKFLEKINYEPHKFGNSSVLQIDGKNIIKKNFSVDGEIQSLVAIGDFTPYKYIDIDFVLSTASTYIILFILISIAIFFTYNLALTGYLTRYILDPLYRLKYGTEKIRKEDYKYTIIYGENNEFGEVISDFNVMKENLRASKEQQKLYEEDRKQLIAGISHDLRTPLTSIKGYSKGILDGVANTDEKRERYLNIIYSKTEELERLIEILYVYSRLESGSIRFAFEEIDFIDYIIKEVGKIKQEYSGRDVDIKYVGIMNREIFVNLDKAQFNRVLFNIVENSCKYGGENLAVRFRTYTEKGYICLEIRDNGQGVAEEKLDRIFEVFYRADSSRTDSGKSSGLGLSIVKRIVEGQGGSISAKNDNGLVIDIKLPRRGE